MNENLKMIIEGTPSIFNMDRAFLGTIHQMISQRKALVQDDWLGLEELANDGIATVHSLYQEMKKYFGVLPPLYANSKDSLLKIIEHHFADEEGRVAFFTDLKAELLNLDPEIEDVYVNGLDELIEGQIANNPLIEHLKGTKHIEEDHEGAHQAIEETVALGVKSLMALTYCNFQKHYTIVKEIELDVLEGGEDLGTYLSQKVKTFGALLDKHLQKIYAAILESEHILKSTEALNQFIEIELPKFARLQATIRHYALLLKLDNQGTASEHVGELAAEAFNLSRSAFASYASAFYLALHSRLQTQDPKVKKALNNAKTLAFGESIPNGKNYDIAKIGTASDGEFVEVAGFVDAIVTGKDNDGRLITQVTLLDPSSGETVVIAGIYVHLLHIGMTVGSYCRMSGMWEFSSGLNKGAPAIKIDKLSINKLSTKSWITLFQDLSDRFVDRWPGGLNIKFGMSPHESGEEEGDSQLLGAGELIYKPFIRI